ncbi:MAG: TIM-barrel domain-containing protein, partial [Spirochaetaceae bacterium]
LAKNRGPFVWLWNYEGSPIDFSRPEGVNWYKEQLRALLSMGAASIKTDFAEQVEPFSQFKELDGRKMHNVYPLLYQKAAFEAIEEERGRGDAVIWARSAWAGAQRYPVHWSGDNSSNHDNLLSCLRGGLSLGLSGFTFWSQDAGGFVGIPGDEVYIRWTQISIFQSHIRYHGGPPH